MTTFTDSFDRTDSTSLGPDWAEVSGDWAVSGNQLSPGNSGGTIILRAASTMASSDHYVQATIAATTAASHGIWGRGNSNITAGYLLRITATDTSVTTGTNVGFRSESSAAIRFDNFTAADISAGATLGTAAATETAQPLTGAKSATPTPATEADGAQALTGSKTATLGSTDSSESAQPLTGAKTATLGTAAATEAAQLLTGSKTASLTPATETSTAQPLTGSKTRTLTPAGEHDTALSLGTPTDPDEAEVDVAIGQPYAREATGQPYTTWETGQPW
jgi:hypothetical protein